MLPPHIAKQIEERLQRDMKNNFTVPQLREMVQTLVNDTASIFPELDDELLLVVGHNSAVVVMALDTFLDPVHFDMLTTQMVRAYVEQGKPVPQNLDERLKLYVAAIQAQRDPIFPLLRDLWIHRQVEFLELQIKSGAPVSQDTAEQAGKIYDRVQKLPTYEGFAELYKEVRALDLQAKWLAAIDPADMEGGLPN